MSTDRSSCEPQQLKNYADLTVRVNAHLSSEAARLAGTLSHFQATCTEYRTSVDSSLADRLRGHGSATVELGSWVGKVALQFELADALGVPLPYSTVDPGAPAIHPELERFLKALGEKFPNDPSEWSQDIFGIQLLLLQTFFAKRGDTREAMRIIGQWLNGASGKTGNVGRMDDLYSTIARDLKYQGRIDNLLKNQRLAFGLGFVTALPGEGIENWEDYQGQANATEKIIVGTVIDTALQGGLQTGGEWAGSAIGGSLLGATFGAAFPPAAPVGIVLGKFIGGYIGGKVGSAAAEWIEESEWYDRNRDKVVEGAAEVLDDAGDTIGETLTEAREDAQQVGEALNKTVSKLVSLF